jgi:CDP-glycerol glycerophosphotransferase
VLKSRTSRLQARYDLSERDATGHRSAAIDVAELARSHALRGETLDFYLEWTRPGRRPPAAGNPTSGERAPTEQASGEHVTGEQTVPDHTTEPLPPRRVRLRRLGGLERVVRPPRAQRCDVDGVEVLLETTLRGNLSLRFDDDVLVRVVATTLDLEQGRDETRMRCELVTHNRAIERATLVTLGRQSQTRVEIDVPFEWLEAQTRSDWGQLHYELTAPLAFTGVAARLPDIDDVIDVALELELEGRSTPARVGFNLPERLEEHRLKSTVGHVGDRAHLFIPYLTFRSHRLAYRVERFSAADYAFLERMLLVSWAFPLIKPFARIWLVGEVPYKAQDNGYHFFRHVRLQHPRRRAYYVIDAASPEKAKLEPLGNVVERFSRRHILYSMMASRLVCSHHSEYLFASRDRRVARRTRGVRVFLQHGITASKNVVPNYARQGTYELSAERFVVASELERRIVMEDYGYSSHQVPVAGFARFDALFADDTTVERTVLIMPTWRELLRTGTFVESDFFSNWHGFLTHPELQRLLRAHDLKIQFLLHPNLRMFADFFDIPNVQLVRQGEADVQQLLKSSAVLITDFSSVAWDFSFLKRPVLYFQFDQKNLVEGRAPHIDPVLRFPGPITTTPESLLRSLAEVIADDLTMSDAYWSRAQDFLAFRDQDNCARIYDVVARAWTPRTAAARVRNARWVQRRWWRFRRGPSYFGWMQRLFKVGRLLPRRNVIVFECDRGAHYGDAPRYLYERLLERSHRLKIVWANNTTMRFEDPRTTKIVRHSPAYYWQLSQARFWVNNQNFPPELAKPDGTRFLQTWHGTPLKRMQHDVDNMLSRDEGYHDRAARLTSYWDALLSGSRYATRCFRSAFKFEGTVLELGYPRNDVFNWPDAPTRARQTRARLGLGDDPRKIILYAPTFRDDNRRGVNWKHKLELDIERLCQEFSDEYVLVVRFHQLVRQPLSGVKLSRPDFLVNGSRYPDIQELMLVSDVLITDYSSLFFDYAVLRRPMLFFTYDLENYRDVLRGFYLDFESQAPGPLLTTNDQVVAALRALDDVTARYRTTIDEFVARYAAQDDGGASDRVLDAFFGPAIGPGRPPVALPGPGAQASVPTREPVVVTAREVEHVAES